jgi:hypothetical protein
LKTCWSNLSYCYTLTGNQFDLAPLDSDVFETAQIIRLMSNMR